MSTEQIEREEPAAAPAAAQGRAPTSPRGLRTGLAWLLGSRDFAFRARRYVISLAATAVVMGLALLLSGVAAGFNNEIQRTIGSFHADAWVVRAGNGGPFTAPTPFPLTTGPGSPLAQVRALPGVREAWPVYLAPGSARTPKLRNVKITAVEPGGLGSPEGVQRHALELGQVLPDATLGVGAGSALTIDGVPFRVGGVTHGKTYFAAIPTVTLSLAQAQRLHYGAIPEATAIVTRGVPSSVPAGFQVLSNSQVHRDLELPIVQAKQTIMLIRTLLWLVAAGIIGAIIYLGVQDRVGEFAVYKAIGVSTRTLAFSLVMQALLLSLLAAVIAAGVELLMAPRAEMSVEVAGGDYLTLAVVACVVGVLASLVALRRAVSVDPVSAFGG